MLIQYSESHYYKMLSNFFSGKKGFASKRVILFSDFSGPFSEDSMEDISSGMKDENIEFNVM